jgi:hypothetical protein
VRRETGGMPINKDNKSDMFLRYSQEVLEKHPDVKLSDVVLIDGRFQVACLLNMLLNTKLDTIIMVHDFWNRPYYYEIKKFVEIIDGADTLIVCKRKRNVNNNEIEKKYNYE